MINKTLQLIRLGGQMVCLSPCVATIGNFDGCHRGHQRIIEQVVERAKQLQLIPTVITFHPMPQQVLRPTQPILKLSPFGQKLQLLKEVGIERVIVLRFNAQLHQIPAEQFIEHYLMKQFQVQHLIVGDNFRFGYQQKGTIELLNRHSKKGDFTCEVVSVNHQDPVSSTAIRQSLLAGDCHRASQLLGRSFYFTKRVIRGKGVATQWGIPTANLPVPMTDPNFKGIFVVYATVDNDVYSGVANLGIRPTYGGKKYLLEAHLFDFSGNLYGKRIHIALLHKLRDEKQFISVDALRQQIEQDIIDAKHYLTAGSI